MPQWQLESHLLSIRKPPDPPETASLPARKKPQQLPPAQSEVTSQHHPPSPQKNHTSCCSSPWKPLPAGPLRDQITLPGASSGGGVIKRKREREEKKTNSIPSSHWPQLPKLRRLPQPGCVEKEKLLSVAEASAHQPAAGPSVIAGPEEHCCWRLSARRLGARLYFGQLTNSLANVWFVSNVGSHSGVGGGQQRKRCVCLSGRIVQAESGSGCFGFFLLFFAQ